MDIKMKNLNTAKILWESLGDIPCNENGEIDQDFNPNGFSAYFKKGTDPEDIWHWFEDTFNISVAKDLMEL